MAAFDPSPNIVASDAMPRMVVVQRYPDLETVERVGRSDAYAPLRALRELIPDLNVTVMRPTG